MNDGVPGKGVGEQMEQEIVAEILQALKGNEAQEGRKES